MGTKSYINKLLDIIKELEDKVKELEKENKEKDKRLITYMNILRGR